MISKRRIAYGPDNGQRPYFIWTNWLRLSQKPVIGIYAERGPLLGWDRRLKPPKNSPKPLN